jgi:hypothetical protein
MGKKAKKRRRQETDVVSLHTNITLGAFGTEQESLDDCLAELEGLNQSVQQDAPPPVAKDPSDDGSKKSHTIEHSSDLWDTSGTIPALRAPQKEWKEAFKAYLDDGTYTDGLLPSIQVEITRHFHVEKLSSYLLGKCPEVRMPVFERWWLDSKWEEHAQNPRRMRRKDPPDPVLPAFPTVDSLASQRLIQEILEAEQMDHNKAEQIVKELCRQTSTAEQEILSLSRRSSSNPLRKGDRIEHEESPDGSSVTLKYSRPGWESPYALHINMSHYQKLQQLFQRVHPEVTQDYGSKRAMRAFDLIAMVLLIRYSSMSGGQLLNDLRGGGMQGAIHPEVFRAIRSAFPQRQIDECFASPMNAYLASFASAFPDIDWHFGSVGTFLEMNFVEGCFEANPPFSPGLMGSMVERIELSLQTANETAKSLTFVVIVPSGSKESKNIPAVKRFASASFFRMVDSKFCRMHVVLSSRQHGYVEAAQHLRPTRYKESTYDTSVILLQSEAAKAELFDERIFENEVREAFASRHKTELEERKRF